MTRSSFPDDPDPIRRRRPPMDEQLANTMFAPLDADRPAQRPPVRKAEQRALPLEESIDAAYAAWLATPAGQATFGKIRDVVLRCARAGNARIGVKSAVERVRWEEKAHIDNRHTSRIARDLIDQHPELEGKIEIRKLEAAGSVSE